MDEQEFNQKFVNDELGIYIIVSDSYNGNNTYLSSLRMKLDEDKIGLMAWIDKKKAQTFLNESEFKNKNLKIVKIYGSDYKKFLETQGEYSNRYRLNINFD